MSTVDPALAVDKALNDSESEAFRRLLVGRWQGAEPADFLDEAMNADAYAGETEKWWATQYGGFDRYRAWLIEGSDLPEDVAVGLLGAATTAYAAIGKLDELDACFGRAPVDLAYRAALWARGYIAGTVAL